MATARKAPHKKNATPVTPRQTGPQRDAESADASVLESIGAAVSQPVRDAAAADSVERALSTSRRAPGARATATHRRR